MFLAKYFLKMPSPFGKRNFEEYGSEKPYVYRIFGTLSPYGFTDSGFIVIYSCISSLKDQKIRKLVI